MALTTQASPVALESTGGREIARQVLAASTSFYWAMRLLPARRREAIFAVYAFCRAVDDIADDEPNLNKRRTGLAEWRREIDRLYSGNPTTLITRALGPAVPEFGLKRADFLAVIDGMEMDAEGPIIAPDRATLDLYCDRVASAVGRLCVAIFGEPGSNGIAVAHHLGRALQLTNIARDVHEDAATGRLYLPRDLLAKHGIPSEPVETVMHHPAFPRLWREFVADAEHQFAEAERALQRCSRRAMRPARIMMEVYRRNLTRMLQLSDADIADSRRSKRLIGKTEMLAIALRHGLF